MLYVDHLLQHLEAHPYRFQFQLILFRPRNKREENNQSSNQTYNVSELEKVNLHLENRDSVIVHTSTFRLLIVS